MPLTVPIPTLVFDALSPGVGPFDGAIEIRLGPVTRADGSVLSVADATGAGLAVYRGGGSEVWDTEASAWAPGATDPDTIGTFALMHVEGQAEPWRATVVPLVAGGDNPGPFDDEGTAFTFRAWFVNGETDGTLGPASDPLRLASLTDAMRAGLRLPPDQDPLHADAVTVYLKDSDLRDLGTLEIEENGASADVSLVRRQGGVERARIRLGADGGVTIRTTTAAGAVSIEIGADGVIRLASAAEVELAAPLVTLDGDLHVNRVSYIPNPAPSPPGARRWLT